MFNEVGENSQPERLRQDIGLRAAISQAAGQTNDLGNPATISFALDFNFQIHNLNLTLHSGIGKRSNTCFA